MNKVDMAMAREGAAQSYDARVKELKLATEHLFTRGGTKERQRFASSLRAMAGESNGTALHVLADEIEGGGRIDRESLGVVLGNLLART